MNAADMSAVDISAVDMSTGAEIRGMRWWDIPAVHALEEQLFPADCWSAEQFWSELAQPTRRYWVAAEGEQIVGYAGLFVLPPDADVQTIAVAGARQGSGVGRMLLDRLLAEARGQGCSHVLLEVRAGNRSALALYERAGFAVVSTRRAYYPDGEDALILELREGAS